MESCLSRAACDMLFRTGVACSCFFRTRDAAGILSFSRTLRYLIIIVGTYAIARGWVDADISEGIVTLIFTAATLGHGIYRTRTAKQ